MKCHVKGREDTVVYATDIWEILIDNEERREMKKQRKNAKNYKMLKRSVNMMVTLAKNDWISAH